MSHADAPSASSPAIQSSAHGPPKDRLMASRSDTAVRVRFLRPPTSDGLLDAGWWPRSRDLAHELPPLLEIVWKSGLNVTNISHALDFWDLTPRRLIVGRRAVQLSGFHTQLSGLLSLTSRSSRGRVDILVIPPETELAVADRALAIVAAEPSPAHPNQVLDRARNEIRQLANEELRPLSAAE